MAISSNNNKYNNEQARDLLYQDQQGAMLRRSLEEQELLAPQTSMLKAPKLEAKARSGTGFGGGGNTTTRKGARFAKQQADILEKDGVVMIENVLSDETADKLRELILEEQQLAYDLTQKDPSKARSFYGVEQARANRCDLQLSLLRNGYKDDDNSPDNFEDPTTTVDNPHTLADALQEILGEQGSLRDLYENLVTLEGEFYELAAVVTRPGSQRQTIHPDLPFQKAAPLYVVFVALQDVTAEMGPTSFLLRSHTAAQNDIFTSGDQSLRDAQLSSSDCRLSCLRKGDAVVFDARILHCGNANDREKGQTRALFNFSFRNPKVEGSLGYEGSIRPGYIKAMSLADLGDALKDYERGNKDPFSKYGSGLL
jgi:hypothetical protein